MPVYNSEAYLSEAVESILGQTFGAFEFVILDDGSTDRSREILEAWAQRDRRIRLIARANRGLIRTRNELLSAARGELIAWADSDDVSYPNRLERQVQCFSVDAATVWVLGAIRLVDPVGRPIRQVDLSNDPGFTGVAMMHRETALKLGGFREELRLCEDRDLALRMAEVGKVVVLPEILVDYRQHPESLCNRERHLVAEYQRLADRLAEERRRLGSDAIQRGEKVDLGESARTLAPESRLATYARWSWQALRAGNVATARRYAARLALSRPFSPAAWKLAYCALRGY